MSHVSCPSTITARPRPRPQRVARLAAVGTLGLLLAAAGSGAATAAAAKPKPRASKAERGIVVHWVAKIHSAAPEAPELRIEGWNQYTGTSNRWHERITNLVDPERSLEDWSSTTFAASLDGPLSRSISKRLKARGSGVYCDGDTDPRGPEYEADLLAANQQVEALRRNAAARKKLPAGDPVDGRPTKRATFDLWADNEPSQRELPLEVFYDAKTGDVVRMGREGTDVWHEYSLWEVKPLTDGRETEPPAQLKARCR